MIVEKLGQSVIPSSIPAHIGEWLRSVASHGAWCYTYMIPLGGSNAIRADWRVNPDGTLNLELQDTSGQPFWRGTFHPAQ